jgi:tetratricopeptide (TPR) repeat protein
MFRCLLALLLCVPLSALAGAPLPDADALYVERDPAAIAMHPRSGDNAAFRRGLNTRIRKDPRDLAALVHRAYLFHASGDIEEGDRDFQRVLDLGGVDSINGRRALWSLGWSAFNRGQPAQAVDFWQQAAKAHGGLPSWYPYTVAVGLWVQGEREAALAWYDSAARSQPDWRHGDGVQARTRHWRAPEKQAVEALFQAWSARAPRPLPAPAG